MITIKYAGSILCPAGFRSVTIVATAELSKSGKMAKVTEVLTIDDRAPGYTSRTGANRQKYNGFKAAELETGKNKRLSTCEVIA